MQFGGGPVVGIGVDTVDIERFRRSLARTPSMRERLFTDEELAYVSPKADPVPSLAGRFAAREAVMKALGLGLGSFGFHDVWVTRADSGAPSLRVIGRAQELAEAAGVGRWHLSITHGELVAVAMVVAEGRS
jgi:holo-[acyl-carrier protein] synthase